MKKTVTIADDHGFVALGLAAELTENGFDVVGTSDNGIDAIAQIKALRPDAALLDLTMPGENGAEVFLEARRWSPKTRFMIVTGNPGADLLAQLLQSGIDGIFLKSDDPKRLSSGLSDILRGRTVISEGVTRLLKSQETTASLTKREVQILQAVARGLSNPMIGKELGVA